MAHQPWIIHFPVIQTLPLDVIDPENGERSGIAMTQALCFVAESFYFNLGSVQWEREPDTQN